MSCKLHHNIIMSCGHTVAVYSGHSKKECQRNVSQCGRKCIDCAIAAQDIRILKLFDSSQNKNFATVAHPALPCQTSIIKEV
jgi:hypothetical protein